MNSRYSTNTEGYQELLNFQLGKYVRAALDVAHDFGVIDTLQVPTNLLEISLDTDIDRECLKRILLVLSASGILIQNSVNEFALAPRFRDFFDKDSPVYVGRPSPGTIEYDTYTQLADGIAGDTASIRAIFRRRWRLGEINEQEAKAFLLNMHQHIMAPMLEQVRSGMFNGVREIVDAGGGSGALAVALNLECSICDRPPLVTVLDLPKVCDVSAKMNANLKAEGLRYHPCNFFKDSWLDGDAYYFSNILHDWSDSEVTFLLKQAYSHLPHGGKVFIHEAFLDYPQPTPVSTMILHLLMYIHNKGRKFKQEELLALLRNAGFVEPKVLHRFTIYSTIVATKP